VTTATTKTERIVADIRRRILSQEFPRGSRLRQDELARELSASITPVREALRILEAEGLLVSEPHKGMRVAGLDLERTKAIYAVRRLTESYAMRRAAIRISPLALQQVREIDAKMREALDAQDATAFRDLNQAFHFYFYERTGMPALHLEIASMWQAFPWDLSLDSVDRSAISLAEHAEILAAVESGDLDQVAAAAEQHVARGFLSLVERATGQTMADPFDLASD
jgi:DNA-binding GntR family transcriptional regulator